MPNLLWIMAVRAASSLPLFSGVAPTSGKPRRDIWTSGSLSLSAPGVAPTSVPVRCQETNTPSPSVTVRAFWRRRCQQHRPSSARCKRTFGTDKRHRSLDARQRPEASAGEDGCGAVHRWQCWRRCRAFMKTDVLFDKSRHAQKRELPPHSHTVHRSVVFPYRFLLDIIIIFKKCDSISWHEPNSLCP